MKKVQFHLHRRSRMERNTNFIFIYKVHILFMAIFFLDRIFQSAVWKENWKRNVVYPVLIQLSGRSARYSDEHDHLVGLLFGIPSVWRTARAKRNENDRQSRRTPVANYPSLFSRLILLWEINTCQINRHPIKPTCNILRPAWGILFSSC